MRSKRMTKANWIEERGKEYMKASMAIIKILSAKDLLFTSAEQIMILQSTAGGITNQVHQRSFGSGTSVSHMLDQLIKDSNDERQRMLRRR